MEPNDDFELGEEDEDSEESLIRYYFLRGFEYKEIILLLLNNHKTEISLSTLKRRIKSYGLRRQRSEYNIDEARASIRTIINGHGSLQGYRSVWHTLQLRETRILLVVVQELLQEMDPEGTELRLGHRLRRRIGYDTLVKIHDCLDRCSHLIDVVAGPLSPNIRQLLICRFKVVRLISVLWFFSRSKIISLYSKPLKK